jgi:hypothetical protein
MKKNNWLSDFDEYEKDEFQKELEENNETEIKSLKSEIDRLKKIIEDMKKSQTVEQEVKVITKITKVMKPVQPKKLAFIDDDLEADLRELEHGTKDSGDANTNDDVSSLF